MGQALVEFALVLPIFLLLLFGLIDVGRLVYTWNALNQAAREGARYGSVAGWADSCNLSRKICIEQTTLSRLAGVPTTVATATCGRYGPGDSTDLPPPPVSLDSCRPNDLLTVTTRIATFRILTPVIGQIIGPVSVTGTSQVSLNQ
jgi:Flp pilus assembly protein TadG